MVQPAKIGMTHPLDELNFIFMHSVLGLELGPCTYRLFLFRFTFDKTKNGNQTVTYRFSLFILSYQNQKTKNNITYRFLFFIQSNETRNTKFGS